MKRIQMLSNKNKNQEPKSDEIKNRESWLKIIIIGAFALVIFYKIATAPFVFRFSDFISVFCSLFAIAISLIYFNKINKLEKMIEAYTTKGKPVSVSDPIEDIQVKEPGQEQLDLFEEEVPVEETEEDPEEEAISEEIFETKRIKEEELAKIEMDKTQLYNELFTRAQLNDEEMKYFNERIREKETESFNTKQELNQFKERIQNVFKRTPQLFQKRDSRIEGIVRMLNPVTLKNATLEELNKRLDHVIDLIPNETLDSLVRDGYLDEHYHLTRSGYREFIQVSKTFQ
jgi:hypothetical protein